MTIDYVRLPPGESVLYSNYATAATIATNQSLKRVDMSNSYNIVQLSGTYGSKPI